MPRLQHGPRFSQAAGLREQNVHMMMTRIDAESSTEASSEDEPSASNMYPRAENWPDVEIADADRDEEECAAPVQNPTLDTIENSPSESRFVSSDSFDICMENSGASTNVDASNDDKSDVVVYEHVRRQQFKHWAEEAKPWIALQCQRGVELSFTDDILKIRTAIPERFKCWKSVRDNMMYASGLTEAVELYVCCPRHMALVDTEKCTVCTQYKPQEYVNFEYIPLLSILIQLVKSKRQRNEMFTYLQGNVDHLKNAGTESDGTGKQEQEVYRDFFDGSAFRDILEKYGPEQVQWDFFIAISMYGFEAFRNKSYSVWPQAGIKCHSAGTGHNSTRIGNNAA